MESYYPCHIIVSQYYYGYCVRAGQNSTSSLGINKPNHEALVVLWLNIISDYYLQCLLQLTCRKSSQANVVLILHTIR